MWRRVMSLLDRAEFDWVLLRRGGAVPMQHPVYSRQQQTKGAIAMTM